MTTTVHFGYERMMYVIGANTQLWMERHPEDPLTWVLLATGGDQDIPLIAGTRNSLDYIMTIIAQAVASESPYVLIETEPHHHLEDELFEITGEDDE